MELLKIYFKYMHIIMQYLRQKNTKIKKLINLNSKYLFIPFNYIKKFFFYFLVFF